ncbi:hypothetical protein A9Q86_03965 [Flavobacteriales bacterium 33_180_T64]|nr:hypothetical protein A9Q86_03965 [Flavobacteriales bacterium 33_180_T64]
MSTKKLLVDAHTFDENHQGIRTFIKGIYSALDVSPSELKVYLVANDIDNLKEEFKNQNNFNYIKLESRNRYIRLAYELPKLIKKHRFDFAHFNYYLPLFLNKDCKYIVTIHDVLFIDFPQYFSLKYRIKNTYLFKRSALKANILTTVSEYSAERIKRNFNIKKKPLFVLPNAINEKYKLEYNKNKDREEIKQVYNIDNFLLYVSRIEPRKNHLKLVRAYQELQLWNRGISLVLIGKESFEDKELEKAIKRVDIESGGKLVRLEDVANEELIKFYNAAQLAVFPSLCEGFGIPPIESAVLKTPTLCSNSTAMKDFTFFESCLFDASSKDVIKLKILEVLNIQEDNHEIVRLQNISEMIKKKYSWTETAKILKNLILND